KGFDTAGREGEDDPTVRNFQINKIKRVFFTMTLNATDGSTLISYQSLTWEQSEIVASVMVPDTTEGDLYLAGEQKTWFNGVIYSRTRPTLPPTPTPTMSPTEPP
ncbi:unnamed protein product, partial [Pylaiella littoralis]